MALNRGFKEAKKFSPEVVVMIDADGQHRIEDLPVIVTPILDGSADLVFGSRYLDDRSDVPRHRVMGHWFFNLLTKRASGTKASDSQNGYRAISAKAFLLTFSSEGFSVEFEMQFIAKEKGLVVLEVPVVLANYLEKPKRSPWLQGVTVLTGVLRLVGQYRPLLYFGTPEQFC